MYQCLIVTFDVTLLHNVTSKPSNIYHEGSAKAKHKYIGQSQPQSLSGSIFRNAVRKNVYIVVNNSGKLVKLVPSEVRFWGPTSKERGREGGRN